MAPITITMNDKKCGIAALRAAIKAALRDANPSARTVSVNGLRVCGGSREETGYGRLWVTCVGGMVVAWPDHSVAYKIGDDQSTWRNFGEPSATMFAFDLDLVAEVAL